MASLVSASQTWGGESFHLAGHPPQFHINQGGGRRNLNEISPFCRLCLLVPASNGMPRRGYGELGKGLSTVLPRGFELILGHI